ncbi:cupredoxin domain-containing protein [Gloeobacter kilaueensis]|uniref:Blue (Type1) copper domain-containing protein n=1 Tax=Gloeobacter kilaueensis (strain ATCC BAA-2537 / CCAP 1431/1 / ULC 316 / JS1) TaxID=1183438 RepID=U5QGP8_GLOK1|nr:cupredoxin family copper-binding protein [Gloeobacter kilaueensis]AGY58152.1 blue (type1) copper domain-containing protein [Gloeobacter kilaueensis JS1]
MYIRYWPLGLSCLGFFSISLAMLTLGGRAAAIPATVTIDRFQFQPVTLKVQAGQAVRFLNKDGEPHTVAAQDGSFTSPALDTGDSWSYAFTQPGTYPYICTIHPFMRGTITVTGAKP